MCVIYSVYDTVYHGTALQQDYTYQENPPPRVLFPVDGGKVVVVQGRRPVGQFPRHALLLAPPREASLEVLRRGVGVDPHVEPRPRLRGDHVESVPLVLLLLLLRRRRRRRGVPFRPIVVSSSSAALLAVIVCSPGHGDTGL